MKSNDKALIGIVAGIILLVIIAFVVTLTRSPATYQADDTPEGVAHNYLLALTQEEFDRAYAYLSPSIAGYPESLEDFEDVVRIYDWRFPLDASIAVLSSEIDGDWATVHARETRFNGGVLFNNHQSIHLFHIYLKWEDGNWKIYDGSRFFARCWKD